MDLRKLTGTDAAPLARNWWIKIPSRYRRQILWNVPEAQKWPAFKTVITGACEVYVWMEGDVPACVGWVEALGSEAGTGNIHLFPARSMGRQELFPVCQKVLSETAMKYLIGFMPKPFRGARALAEDIGFRLLGVFPGACAMADRGLVVDGFLYGKDLRA